MSEAAELKSRLKDLEDERDLFRAKYNTMQKEILLLNEKLSEKERELTSLKTVINNNKNLSNGDALSHGLTEDYESLKKTVNDLLIENDEKDLKIEELRKAVSAYQRVEEIIMNSRVNRPKSEEADAHHSTVTTPNRDRNCSLSPYINGKIAQQSMVSPPPVPKHGISVQRSNSYDASRFNRIIIGEPQGQDVKNKGSCTSLPRDYGNRLDMTLLSPNKNKPLPSANDPSLENEVFLDEEENTKEQKKKKGLKRFFARIRRSSSQENVDGKAFKRGGVRATAGARLGGNQSKQESCDMVKSDTFLTPFARWTNDQVATWLSDLGLGIYANDCRKWCRSGQHMMEASKNEVEKELKINHPLHRKKLQLALDSIKTGNKKEQFMLSGLNADWISKWLDDIGLPQYKGVFQEAKIDGRMLNQITVDDLLFMKINNALHHLSIRRGIEVLRMHNFNLGTLKRRPSKERTSEFMSSTLNGSVTRQDSAERDISLWTNHRVMEWLRMIDLSEYAANLRGSGVHGALIMLEPRFTVEHLADILNIPTNKTLLRRHLSAHFVNLVGQKTQAQKRDAEHLPGMALGLNTKVKSKKPNLFRRGRPVSAYICPIEKIEPIDTSTKAEDRRIKNAVALYKELSKQNIIKHESKSLKNATN